MVNQNYVHFACHLSFLTLFLCPLPPPKPLPIFKRTGFTKSISSPSPYSDVLKYFSQHMQMYSDEPG